MPKTGCRGYRSSVNRRAFLGAGIGGLSLPTIFQSSVDASGGLGEIPADTAVIQYWLNGAASHFETYDPKPNAPAEIRGSFSPISTNVPGVQICETLPLHAKLMDKVTIIRGMQHDNDDHQHGMHWCQTGHDAKAHGVNPFKKSSHPSSGSMVSMLRGPNHPGLPPYVLIGYPLDKQGIHRFYPHRAAHLGVRFNPLEILKNRTGDGKDPGLDKDFRVRSLAPIEGLTRESLIERRKLLAQFDQIREPLNPTGTDSWRHFHKSAFDLITGARTGGAFDLEQEDVKTRERYGLNRSGQSALLARRLVEAGVTFVTVIDPGVGLSSSGWDLHTKLEWGMNTCCPRMDHAVTTLIEDLYERGLNKKVLVVVWGEFGRTPKINAKGGRDHWGRLQSMMLAGGNYQHGQVIGSSNAKGEVPKDRPLWPYDVVATMYHHLGIDPRLTPQTSVGRSVPILEKGEVISELL
ncbi:MAG: DUF1501 domain-containing protein [Planctomycetaceae bacterium]|jgi:hypothetical protein|nr:DUF1501 domain-containing protein [Planctomycetaceae bacterium]MBT6486460.1 DUF1501 domain-containing protein [Planctomycetaceae bacterium]MBT6493114.1 DUF1501 domain-containing protein [Planctomycetaceae bacterium]